MRIARIKLNDGQVTLAVTDETGQLRRAQGDVLAGTVRATDEVVQAAAYLPPIDPRAIFCIGANYKAHAEEGGGKAPDEPILFMKNPAAVNHHGGEIRLPKVCGDEVDYECELAVVIGKAARDVPREQALDYVLGYTCGNDVSARIWQKDRGGGQWVRGKSFDTFCPLGPTLVTADEIADVQNLALKTELNGETVQSSNTGKMIFPIARLIEFMSQDTTLLPGTVIMTGTPEGVGWCRSPRRMLQPGDHLAVEVQHIGRLENTVK